MAMSGIRILVSLPCYGGQLVDRALSSFTQLLGWTSKQDIFVRLNLIANESLLPRARNMGVAKLIDNHENFTHILFIDADMGYSPYRLQRLLEADKDFVGCPGPVKFIYWERIHEAILNGEDPESFCLRYAFNLHDTAPKKVDSGFTKVKNMGCCFFLVKTSAIMKMVDHYSELRCQHMANVNGRSMESENTYTFFDTHKLPDGTYLECDHAFMHRWESMGGEIWADMTSDLSHSGMYCFKGDMGKRYFGRPNPGMGFQANVTGVVEATDSVDWPVASYPESSQNTKYHITTIRPTGNPFPSCYTEQARMIQKGLQSLGHDCTRLDNKLDPERTNIVFNFHEWWDGNPLEIICEHHMILYQGEQITPGGRLLPDWYFKAMALCGEVWDYSEENVEFSRAQRINSKWCPPAWHPCCETVDHKGVPKDIDIVFTGVLNPRRSFLLNMLSQVFKVTVLSDVFGSERDEYLARARLGINIHFYGSQTLELMRVGHLMANGIPVLSEPSVGNPYEHAIMTAKYSSFLKAAVEILSNENMLADYAWKGKRKFQEKTIEDVLKGLLEVPAETVET